MVDGIKDEGFEIGDDSGYIEVGPDIDVDKRASEGSKVTDKGEKRVFNLEDGDKLQGETSTEGKEFQTSFLDKIFGFLSSTPGKLIVRGAAAAAAIGISIGTAGIGAIIAPAALAVASELLLDASDRITARVEKRREAFLNGPEQEQDGEGIGIDEPQQLQQQSQSNSLGQESEEIEAKEPQQNNSPAPKAVLGKHTKKVLEQQQQGQGLGTSSFL